MATPIPFPVDGVIQTNVQYTYTPTNFFISILPMTHLFEKTTVLRPNGSVLIEGYIGGMTSYSEVDQGVTYLLTISSPLERSLKVTIKSIFSIDVPDFNNEKLLATYYPTGPVEYITFPTPGFYAGDLSNTFKDGEVIQVCVEGAWDNDKLINRYRSMVIWGVGVPGQNIMTPATLAEIEQGSPEIFVVQNVKRICWRVINERGGPTIMRFQKITAPTV